MKKMSEKIRIKVNEHGLDSRKDTLVENVGMDVKRHRKHKVDNLDLQLIGMSMAGKSSRACADILKKPISTTQRRIRLLIQGGILRPTFELGYSELGLKKGFLHVYLEDGNIEDTKNKLLTRDGIYSVGVHLGNSDIVGQFVFKDTREVLNLMAWAKHLEGVQRVVWSEEVFEESANPQLIDVFYHHPPRHHGE